MPKSTANPEIRDLETLADLERALHLEQKVWGLSDADAIPLTMAAALQAAGSIWLGAFDDSELIGFALAFPSLEWGKTGFHSHMLAVRASHRGHNLGYKLKLAQRGRTLAHSIKEMTWTFDPLRGRNAHLNFQKLGAICDSYRADFYGPRTSSPLHRNGTDRLWVSWHLADSRVEERLKGKDLRAENLDALALLEPLIRFNGDGRPAEGDLAEALARQRIAIEIPGDIDSIETEDPARAREWRLATRNAFTEAIKAGFIVKEFCRSIRGQQGPGAYLLERPFRERTFFPGRNTLNIEMQPSNPILLYDGVCGLCNRFVRFILRHDHRDHFRFAALQSNFARTMLERHGLNPDMLDTVYLVFDHGLPSEQLLSRNEAATAVLKELGSFWRLWARLLDLLPRRFRDWRYNFVAKNRYRFFGKYETCPLPKEKDRHKFLDA